MKETTKRRVRGALIALVCFLLGGLVVWKHRANIQRLLAGNENKLSFHKKKT